MAGRRPGDKPLSEPIADTFNDFFSNVGRNLDQKIGSADKNFRKYLSNRMNSSFSLLQY